MAGLKSTQGRTHPHVVIITTVVISNVKQGPPYGRLHKLLVTLRGFSEEVQCGVGGDALIGGTHQTL